MAQSLKSLINLRSRIKADNRIIIDFGKVLGREIRKSDFVFWEKIKIREEVKKIEGRTIREVIGKRRKYKEIISISEEDLKRKERFLTDWHVLRYLERDSGVLKIDIVKVLVSLRNLLKDCEKYSVDEINLVCIRMLRKDKFFVVTDY